MNQSKIKDVITYYKAKGKNLDLSIFKEDHKACNDSNISECAATDRLAVALKYCSVLQVKEEEKHREIFTAFIHDIYPHILEDNNHLIKYHSKQLTKFKAKYVGDKRLFAECTMESCKFTQRHFEEATAMTLDTTLNFYIQIMDSLHFYMFHCYDAGFRISSSHEATEPDDANSDKEFYDKEFARITRAVRSRDHLTNSFERISPQNTKFTIKVADDEKERNTTFLDELYVQLGNDNVDVSVINKLQRFMNAQLYDSDTIKDENECNISTVVNNTKCIESISNFIKSAASYFPFFLILFVLVSFIRT